eukprot:1146957-Pelagomonas_calceolata.AAC.3
MEHASCTKKCFMQGAMLYAKGNASCKEHASRQEQGQPNKLHGALDATWKMPCPAAFRKSALAINHKFSSGCHRKATELCCDDVELRRVRTSKTGNKRLEQHRI